uniref:Uncharacterized protein n=1 Tax=Romanomermis culicivorax TaxID=13658 RepID=A0A915JX72_ROMCU
MVGGQTCWQQRSQWQQVPLGREVVLTQQGRGSICLAMVLQVNLLNIRNFQRLGKWGVLRIGHPAVDQTDSGVVGLQQAGGVIQTAGFI